MCLRYQYYRNWPFSGFRDSCGSLDRRSAFVRIRIYFCIRFCYNYSGTPPYDHPVYKTTSLLRPYSFKPNVKTIESFYYFEDPVNATTSLLRPRFYGPTVVALTGFHCTSLPEKLIQWNPALRPPRL